MSEANTAFNPLSSSQLKRLRDAWNWSFKQLEPFRKHNLNTIHQYVGRHYGHGNSQYGDTSKRGDDYMQRKATPVPYLSLAIGIYLQTLVAQAPGCGIETADPQLEALADTIRVSVDYRLENMDAETTLQGATLSAIICMGIVNTGIDTFANGIWDDEYYSVGVPFAKEVSIDDWCHDCAVQVYPQVSFAGHKLRMPYEFIMESGLFKNIDGLKPSGPLNLRLEDSDQLVSGLSKSNSFAEEYKRHVNIIKVWLPSDNLLILLPADSDTSRPIWIEEWTGPGHGPFHLLNFFDVPDNIVGLAPTMLWRDLDMLGNKLMRKMSDQAQRAKQIFITRPGGKATAEAIQAAKDGEIITGDPSMVTPINYNGLDPQLAAFNMQIRDLLSYFAGNLDAIGGLGPQSETLGQDQLLSQSANKRVQQMRARENKFAKGIMEDIAFYDFHDPLLEMDLIKTTPQARVKIPVRYQAAMVSAKNFQDFLFKVKPHSMQHETDEMKLQKFLGLWGQLIMPMMPIIQEQGGTLDIERVLHEVAKLSRLPVLENAITFPGGLKKPPEPKVPGPKMPGDTTRRYIRENVSTGGTRQARDNVLAQAFLGQGVQPSQAGALMQRPA